MDDDSNKKLDMSEFKKGISDYGLVLEDGVSKTFYLCQIKFFSFNLMTEPNIFMHLTDYTFSQLTVNKLAGNKQSKFTLGLKFSI